MKNLFIQCTRYCVCDEIHHSVVRSAKIGHYFVHEEALELKYWESVVIILFDGEEQKWFLLRNA